MMWLIFTALGRRGMLVLVRLRPARLEEPRTNREIDDLRNFIDHP